MNHHTLSLSAFSSLLLAACAAPTGSAPSPMPSEVAKADGIDSNEVTAIPVDLGGAAVEATLDPSSVLAYVVEVDEPQTIAIDLEWKRNAWSRFVDGLRASDTRYETRIYVFMQWSDTLWTPLGPTRFSDELQARWDFELPVAGRYLLRVDAPTEAYDDEASCALAVRATDAVEPVPDGDLILVFASEVGRGPAEMRVRVGDVDGLTSSLGLATLRNVPAGEHVVQLGPDLSARPADGGEVVGDELLEVRADVERIVYLRVLLDEVR